LVQDSNSWWPSRPAADRLGTPSSPFGLAMRAPRDMSPILKRLRKLLLRNVDLRSGPVTAAVRFLERTLPFDTFATITGLKDLAQDPSSNPVIPPKRLDAPAGGMAASRWTLSRVERILLIHPPFAMANRRHKKTMPMGLLSLGSYVRKKLPAVHVELLDAHIMNMTVEEIVRYATSNPFDVVLLTGWTAQMPVVYAIADAVRSIGRSAVVLGGAHSTLCSDEAIEHADFVVRGEGEIALVNLLSRLLSGDVLGPIEGVISHPGEVTHGPQVADLNDLPLPDWSLLPNWALYDHPLHVVGGFRFPIMGSRGCPFNCTFCCSPLIWNRTVRWHSPEWIVAQMEEAWKRHKVCQFHFWDDNLLLAHDHMAGLCDRILKMNHPCRWVGLTRASSIVRHHDLLPLLKKAGCIGLEIGVESFTEVSAEMTQKGESIQEMVLATELLIEHEIAPLFTHMLFTPGERLASYTRKEEFLNKLTAKIRRGLRSDSELGQLTTPHRGTIFSREATKLGMVCCRDNADYVHHRVNFIPNSLLDDVPKRVSHGAGSPYYFLGVIVTHVFNWTLKDMKDFLEINGALWTQIDGQSSIRELSRRMAERFPHLDEMKSSIFTALCMVGWAREGRVMGVSPDRSDNETRPKSCLLDGPISRSE